MREVNATTGSGGECALPQRPKGFLPDISSRGFEVVLVGAGDVSRYRVGNDDGPQGLGEPATHSPARSTTPLVAIPSRTNLIKEQLPRGGRRRVVA